MRLHEHNSGNSCTEFTNYSHRMDLFIAHLRPNLGIKNLPKRSLIAQRSTLYRYIAVLYTHTSIIPQSACITTSTNVQDAKTDHKHVTHSANNQRRPTVRQCHLVLGFFFFPAPPTPPPPERSIVLLLPALSVDGPPTLDSIELTTGVRSSSEESVWVMRRRF